MKKYLFMLSVILYGVNTLIAGDGTSGFEFLRTDFSPRSSAMGGAYVAMRGDVHSFFNNPAGMAYMENSQVTANYADYLLDIGGGFAAYSNQVAGWGQVSAAVMYFDYGDFDESNQFAEKTGRTYGARDIALGLSMSGFLSNELAYGVTAKYVHSKIDVWTASALVLDFGLIYETPFENDLFIGISLQNVGKSLSAYIDTKESLPTTLKIGFAKKLEHLPLEFNGSFNDLNISEGSIWDRLRKFSIGGEFTLSEMLRLRLGYDNALHSSLKTDSGAGFAGVSIGFGLLWEGYRLDYGFSSFGDLGSTNRFGISTSF